MKLRVLRIRSEIFKLLIVETMPYFVDSCREKRPKKFATKWSKRRGGGGQRYLNKNAKLVLWGSLNKVDLGEELSSAQSD